MARSRNASATKKVQATIAVAAYERLEWLAAAGLYGSNSAEVAKYLIINGLDQLTRQKVLPLTLPEKGPLLP